MNIVRTDITNADFLELVAELDNCLAVTDEDEHDFYHQFNGVASLKHVYVLYINDFPVACGAFKHIDDITVEIKRMYTRPDFRGKGYGNSIIKALEIAAAGLGYQRCILETGKRQPDAIALYTKANYQITENYGQYVGLENSVCFEKWI